MRTLLFIILSLLLRPEVMAQTLYYNAHLLQTVRDSAKSYVIFSRAENGYDARQYSLQDRLQMEGHYSAIASTLDAERDGLFTYYHSNGKIAKRGAYKQNLKTGLWENFAFATGKTFREEHFDNDLLDGLCTKFDWSTEQKICDGMYKMGKKEGLWKFYLHDTLTSTEAYTQDKITAKTKFDKTGKVVRKLFYQDGVSTSAFGFDSSGREIPMAPEPTEMLPRVFTYVEEMPTPTFDMSEYLRSNLRYPPKARRKNQQGRVIVKFVINEDGHVSDIVVVRGLSPELDEEGMRVVQSMPIWNPGMQDGKPVKVYFNLPLNFVLN